MICDYKNFQCICSVGLRSINPFITYIGLCRCVIESNAHRIVMLYVKLVGNVFCYKELCLSHNNEYLKVILIHSIFSVYPLTHKESYSTEDEKPIKSTLCLCLCICYTIHSIRQTFIETHQLILSQAVCLQKAIFVAGDTKKNPYQAIQKCTEKRSDFTIDGIDIAKMCVKVDDC